MINSKSTLMDKIIPNLQQFLFLIFLSLTILVLDSSHFLEPVKKWAFFITNPLSFGIYRTNQLLSRQFYFIFASRQSAQENRALKEQIGQLLSENANLRRKLSETETQLTQEYHLDPKTYNLIASRPIGLTRYLKIDKGMDSGLKMGQAVVFKDNYIGKIIQISNVSSSIQLLSDPESKISAFSQGLSGRGKGVLIGQFGTEILMDKILHEEQIEVGDLVYSEGIEGFLPRGLVLGRVTQVIDAQNQIFKQAKVKPVFDIGDLELVFVIAE